MLNRGEEGNTWMKGGGHDEEVASSEKKKTNSRLECKSQYPISLLPKWWQNGYNQYPIYDQNG